MKKVTDSIYYVGVNDHIVDLFEGQYKVPLGMAYNSYVVKDDLTVVFDTVDIKFFDEWMANIKEVLGDSAPNFLVVQHMEPDHSANIMRFLDVYPDTYVIGNKKTFVMMEQFFHEEIKHKMVVDDGGFLNTGKHCFTFVFAPMVHWPEVMVTYDSFDKVLFSADGFGKFGANDVEDPEGWDCEARRYYFGIVGKYGAQVQNLLKKASALDIQIICPLHGPVLTENLGHYIRLYDIWSSYQSETDGIAIFYTSVYGHTKEAALLLKELVEKYNVPKVCLTDLAREDQGEAVENAFRYSKIVLATTTYNAGIFPFMNDFIEHLVERDFKNKEIAIIENGSWAPMAARVIKNKLANSKNLNFVDPVVTILSSMSEGNKEQLDLLAKKLCSEYEARKDLEAASFDPKALFNIGYGLYVATTNDGRKDNGLIINTVSQVTNDPNRIAVVINKANYSCETVKVTKKLNINVIDETAKFDLFKKFGFVSGRDVNKFEGEEVSRSANGLVVLDKNVNSFISLEVYSTVDLGTHIMFVCDVKESRILSNSPTMTYTYYQNNVKEKPNNNVKKGWVCKVCGYVYEGDELPSDYVCPLCKHGASDFEKIG